MAFPDDRIKLELMLSSSQPELLEGLDVWLRLGLLSEVQVKLLCQKYLTCPLPERVVSTSIPASPVSATPKNILPKPVKQPQPSWVSQMLQSLKAELSVRWLLFLGVFMVVVSSGVLAATQWERFPAYGQYGVLLTYTLIFWAVSFWASKQRNLQLTAQTLQLVTLFLIPVNFWAIDGFHLWGNLLEWVIVAIASITLTSITLLVFRNQPRIDRSVPINYLALSYLHWGWKLPIFPLIAVYLGIIGTTIFLIWRYAGGGRRQEADGSSEQTENKSPHSKIGILVYAVTVLLVRAIFGNYVEITELGLAIAICGWLFAWLSWQNPSPLTFSPPFSQSNWELIGGILLLLGWVVSVGADPSWQAIAVSGLGWLFFNSRLQRFWLYADLAAILAIGLQAVWLFWRAIPLANRELLINTGIQLANAQDHSYALLSVGLFPYVIWILILTDWLYRREKQDLAEFGEAIAFSFALILTGISLVNPLLRSVNLFLSTLTFGIVYWRRPRSGLVYLTHITAILTLTSTVNYFFPYLNQENWATIFLGLMVGEWGFSILRKEQSDRLSNWQESAWYIGLSLAGLSYFLYGTDLNNSIIKLCWAIAPVMLTLIAIRSNSSRRKVASWLSVGGLGLLQILTLPIAEARLVSLGIATGVMLVNTRCLQELTAAIITVGFAIAFLGVALWEGFPELSIPDWMLVIAVAIAFLWFLQTWFLRRSATTLPENNAINHYRDNLTSPPTPLLQGEGSNTPPFPGREGGSGGLGLSRFGLVAENNRNIQLFLIYGRASDVWGIFLCSLELFWLTLHSFRVYRDLNLPSVIVLMAIIITSIAVAYRHWRQPKDWGIFAIGWGLELFTAEIIGFTGNSIINLSVANIALGLVTQLLGDWWRRRVGASRFPTSLHAVPLLYGALGVALRWGVFTDWTGLGSIGISLIAIGIGRRSSELKPLVYLGLTGISISAYELLLYQLSKTSGGAIGDGLIAMAALGTSIMYAYRVLSPWLSPYLTISLEEIKTIAHLHWAWSSFILIFASLNPIKASLFVGLGTGILLIRYAIFQGRRHPNPIVAEVWIYLGILELVGMRIYWMNTPIAQLFGDPLAPWRAAIATIPAIFIYLLPWESWGWPKRPWQIAGFLWPLLMMIETALIIHPLCLLIVAGFYILISRLNQEIRFTYLSAVLIDWALFRWFAELQLSNLLWYVIPVGLSLLYVAQVDPKLTLPEQRQTRHSLRVIAISIICFTSLWTEQWTGLGSGFLSIFTIVAGLGLRIRAFLYIGTATFLINAVNQLVILNFRYTFLKWLIGLIVGILFIWIAANFETRREQITTLVRNWINELANWE